MCLFWLHYWNICLVDYRILVSVFSLSSLKILFFCFLTSLLLMSLFKLFEFIWTFELFLFTPRVIFSAFFLKIFCSSWVSLWYDWVQLFYRLALIGAFWDSWSYTFLYFTKLRKFQPLFLQISCSLHFSLFSSSGIPIIQCYTFWYCKFFQSFLSVICMISIAFELIFSSVICILCPSQTVDIFVMYCVFFFQF